MKKLVLLCLFLLVMFLAAPFAVAEVKTGHFQVELYSENSIQWDPDPSVNDGYESTWYNYPQDSPPWWNEWWYDDPYQLGGKWVQVTFDYALINPLLPGDVHVTINWTNGLWEGVEQGRLKPPIYAGVPNPELYIERLSDPEYNINQNPWNLHLEPLSPGGSYDSTWFLLPIDYNPEWVSVDVQGMGNVGISNGILLHECVPEPATLILLCLGGLSLLRKHRT
jgi:hypothetical protein